MRRRSFNALGWVLFLGMILAGSGPRFAAAGEIVFDHFMYLPIVLKLLPAADLTADIVSVPRPYVAGAPITYTVTLFNAGPETSPALTLTHTLPQAALNPVFAPSRGLFNPETGTWEGVTLTAGSRVTLTIAATVAPTATGILRAGVVVTPSGAYDPNAANNRAEDANPTFLPITDALLNPGFEAGHWWWTHYGERPEMPVPQDWIAWWSMDTSQGFEAPELVRLIDWLDNPVYQGPPARIHTGNRAFTMYRWGKYQGGLYQRVTNLPPGARAGFSIYAHAWTCNDDPPPAYSCGDLYSLLFRVGIDPTGGLDPWSPNIVWSEDAWYRDVYDRVGPVEATVGADGAITVFVFGQAKWPLKHNDAYWDDAALIVTP